MALHRDMKTLGDDVAAVRRLAAALLAMPDVDWTEWERLFLDGMVERRSEAPLSMRQREILVDLRDGVTSLTTVDGLSIPSLIRACWLARLELGDDDVAFIERIAAEAPRTLRKRAAYRLRVIAQELDVVPPYAMAI